MSLLVIILFITVGFLLSPNAVSAQTAVDYVWNIPPLVATSSANPILTTKLTNEIEKMIQDKDGNSRFDDHVLPFSFARGVSSDREHYFLNPAETLLTLSTVYPYVPANTQAKIKEYLLYEVVKFPPTQTSFCGTWPNSQCLTNGTRREYGQVPPELLTDLWIPPVGSPPASIENLYGVWAYGYYLGEWNYLQTHYAEIRNLYTNFRTSINADANNIRYFPQIGGLIGFARIAQHFGDNTNAQEAANFASSALQRAAGNGFTTYRRNSESLITGFDTGWETDPNHYAESDQYFTIPLFFYNFSAQGQNTVVTYMTQFPREIGLFLKDNSQAQVRDFVSKLEAFMPGWSLTKSGKSGYGENSYEPMDVKWTMFKLHAYSLGTSQEQLMKYIGSGISMGDLFYLQMLTAAIEASSSSSSPSPTSAQSCTLQDNSAVWSSSSSVEGTSVNLSVTATGDCTGKSVNFDIRENNTLPLTLDTDVAPDPQPSALTFNAANNNYQASTSWITIYQDDSLDIFSSPGPEYFFNVTVPGGNTLRSNDPLLKVTQYTPTASTDWSQVGKDPQHTSYSGEVLGTNFKVAWTYPFMSTNEKVFPQVQAIVYDGKVIIGTEMGNMYALDAINPETGSNPPKGKVLWKYTTSDAVTGKPAPIVSSIAADNGKIFFGAIDGAVYALNAENGTLAWKKQVQPRLGFTASPIIADNKIMLGGQDGKFYALNPSDGTILWSYDTGSPILQTAAYNDGKIYFGAMNMFVYALNTNPSNPADPASILAWKSAKIKGIGFKDYWPVVYKANPVKGVNRGLVLIRPMAGSFDWGLRTSSYDSATQQSVLSAYDANPSATNKSLVLLYEDTGEEAPAVIHWDVFTMNGTPTSPCIDRDGNIIVAGRKPNPSPTPGLNWMPEWVRVNPSTRMVEEVLYDPTANNTSNNDETTNVTCSQNLVLAFHFSEDSALAAGYQGAFNLDTKRWTNIPAGWKQGYILTPAAGNNPASISNGRIYHMIFNELIVRTTQ